MSKRAGMAWEKLTGRFLGALAALIHYVRQDTKFVAFCLVGSITGCAAAVRKCIHEYGIMHLA